jgi:ABC-type multidrug transport system ATPase subunit
LDEVERVADDLVMMFHGRIVAQGPLDDLKQKHRRFVLRFETVQSTTPKIDGALGISGSAREWTIICNGKKDLAMAAVAQLGGKIVAEEPASLEEIFVAQAGGNRVEYSTKNL